MLLHGIEVLTDAGRRNKSLKYWLSGWEEVVRRSDWHNLAEVRQSYSAADPAWLKSRVVVTIFNVKGNEYRLETSIDYGDALAKVLSVMTHSAYDKNFWKAKY